MQTLLDVKPIDIIDGIEYYEYPLITYYWISKQGEVYNANTCQKLKTSISRNSKGYGYYTANLCRKRVKLHRMLAETFLSPVAGKVLVDHISRNSLDNRLENLRWCNHADNAQNRGSAKNATSKYVGVWTVGSSDKPRYKVGINCNGIKYHVGYFTCEDNAARAYNKKAAEIGSISFNNIK